MEVEHRCSKQRLEREIQENVAVLDHKRKSPPTQD